MGTGLSLALLLAALAATPAVPLEDEEPANEVTGVVVDGAGRPIAGAVIFVDGQRTPGQDLRRWRPWSNGGDLRGRSGPDGKFRILVRTGRINVMAGLLGDTLRARAAEVDTGRPETLQGLRLSFGGRAVIAGRVLDPEGRPVRGVQVRVFPEPTEAAPEGGASFGVTRTDAEGRFQVPDLRPGAYRLFAEGAGYWCRTGDKEGLPVQSGIAGLVVPVRPMTSIHGTVTVPGGPDGRKAPKRFVIETQPSGAWAFDGEDGSFEVPIHAPWKRLGVFVRAQGFGWLAFAVDLESGEQKDLGEIQLGPPRTVNGRVLDARGAPVAGAKVKLGYASHSMTPRPTAEPVEDVTTDAMGRFALPDVASAAAPLRVESPGHRRTEAVAPAGGHEVVIRLEEGAQLNLLVEEADGRPLDGAAIRVAGPKGGRCSSAEGGHCDFTGLAPGHQVLLLHAPSSGSAVTRPKVAQLHVDVAVGGSPATGRYRAPRRPSSLKVHLAGADGKYVLGAVYVIPGEVGPAGLLGVGRRPVVAYYLGSDDPGHAFVNLPPDRYTVVAASSVPVAACSYTVVDLAEGADQTLIVRMPADGAACVRSP
jgi:Carboxypeptidase regulatory-like domain